MSSDSPPLTDKEAHDVQAVRDAFAKPSAYARFKHWVQDRDYHVWVMSLGTS